MQILKFRANFPTMPSGTDIDVQEFSVEAGGEVQPVQTLGNSVTSAEFEVTQGADVTLRLIYVDDAGNRSQPRTQEFVAADTLPPDAPGEFGAIENIGERTVEDA